MKIALVVGTRPEIIKMAPVIRECQARQIDFVLVHSNQHYSENMDGVFFKELELPQPHYNLNVGSGTHSNQLGNILIKIEPVLAEEKPDVVLVQGDTNTVLAAALSAHKLGIKVGHIEAGLRSYDRTMPEESNRVTTDHMSDFMFAVTDVQAGILAGEGLEKNRIHTVGNTIVDAVLQNRERARNNSKILSNLKLQPKSYCLFTAHRAANVDQRAALEEILNLVAAVPMPVVWPIHVRTTKKVAEFGLKMPANVINIDPLGYYDFLNLEQFAQVIVTDSGGVQEEACILGVPCVTIRENTERPETVTVGANVLVGRSVEKLKAALNRPLKTWKNPFGDGTSAKQIVNIVIADHQKSQRTDKISVVGLGYMGLPTSLLFAEAGFQVAGFDINPEKVRTLNDGICPFDEPGVPELLKSALSSGRFHASTKLEAADVFIIAVPTPHVDKKCDLTFVVKAAEAIASVARNGNLVIVESTIKPRTCLEHVLPVFAKRGLDVQVAHCPERAIPGETLKEIQHNDRIVGGMTEEVSERVRNLYSSFVKGSIFTTDVTTAEVVKLMENTFRDVNIALANEFSKLADDLGFNVFEAIRLANRHPRVNILQPGPGVGGHCIAIDPWFLTEDTDRAHLIRAAREVNDSMPATIVERFKKMANGKNVKRVGLLGLAYKKNVDDSRESPAEHIFELIKKEGYQVEVHDPLVKDWPTAMEADLNKLESWADAFVLITDHDEYASFKTTKPILDTRNFFHLSR